MLLEIDTLVTVLSTILVINLTLLTIVWRFNKEKIRSLATKKLSIETIASKYQLKEHTPRM